MEALIAKGNEEAKVNDCKECESVYNLGQTLDKTSLDHGALDAT